jgi:hypothetical protein
MTTRKDCIHILENTGPIKIGCCNQAVKYGMSYKCELHKRCVDAPMILKKKVYMDKWKDMKPESDIYTLCQTCCEYSNGANIESQNENSEK